MRDELILDDEVWSVLTQLPNPRRAHMPDYVRIVGRRWRVDRDGTIVLIAWLGSRRLEPLHRPVPSDWTGQLRIGRGQCSAHGGSHIALVPTQTAARYTDERMLEVVDGVVVGEVDLQQRRSDAAMRW